MSICNGNKGSFEDIKKLLEEYGNEKKEELGERAVTDSLEELLEDSKYNTRWVFNIKDLKEKVGGVGPAIFIEVAARPEVGKTCFWVSLAASPGGFCWQGAKVLALCNEEKATRVKLRAFSSATGFTHDELATKAEEAKRVYSQIADKLRIYDVVGIHLDDIAALIDKETPDIVVVDQLDKVRIDGEFTSAHQKLRELYLQARELSKRKNNAFFAISQLSADAQDKMYPDYSMLENSKTGKAAEADAIFCLGQSPAINDFTRGISIPKNKITGNHQACHVRIQPEISRFVE